VNPTTGTISFFLFGFIRSFDYLLKKAPPRKFSIRLFPFLALLAHNKEK
jgi:hypothetical protein